VESQCLGTAFRLQLENKTKTLSSSQPLSAPVKMGDLLLSNRIVMAPLTRMRADNPGHVPNDLHTRQPEP
jgi:NADH:flavin oxidoreductase / NADH oxidase family